MKKSIIGITVFAVCFLLAIINNHMISYALEENIKIKAIDAEYNYEYPKYPYPATRTYSEDRAWVRYYENEEESKGVCYALIDKNGFIRYSFNVEEAGYLLERKYYDKTQKFISSEKIGVNVSDVIDGYSTINCINKSYYSDEEAITEIIIIDKDGNETYRKKGNESTHYYIDNIGGGYFIQTTNTINFEKNEYEFIVIDKDGKEINTISNSMFDYPTLGTIESSSFKYLGEDYYCYINNGYLFIYNIKTNEFYEANINIDNSESSKNILFDSIEKSYNGNCLLYDRSYSRVYGIPIDKFESRETFTDYILSEKGCFPLESDAQYGDISSHNAYGEGLIYCRYADNPEKEGYYNLELELEVKLPEFPDTVSVEHVGAFSGDYAPLLLKGADSKNYVTIINKKGEMQYQPIKISQTYPPDFCKGYYLLVFNSYDLSKTEVITPDGKYLTGEEALYLFDDDFTQDNKSVYKRNIFCGMVYVSYAPYTDYDCYFRRIHGETIYNIYILDSSVDPDTVNRDEVTYSDKYSERYGAVEDYSDDEEENYYNENNNDENLINNTNSISNYNNTKTNTNYSNESINEPLSETKIIVPSKVKISSLKNNKSKKITIKWKAVNNSIGYSVQYAINKKFTKSKKTKITSKLSLTVEKLKKNKTYYVRVRAYNLDSSGNKVYGKWSATKKIKIKK